MLNLFCKDVDRYYIGQIYSGDFSKFCGLLRMYELKKHIPNLAPSSLENWYSVVI